jgi:hypothetical protein
MPTGITLDWKEFDRAMVDYAAASGKDFAEITNKKLGDVAMRAAQFSPKADKGKIRSTGDWHTTPWWPAFIQKVIGKGFKIHGRKKATGSDADVVWIDTPTGKKKRGRKTMGYDRMASAMHADAVRVSKAIIKRRLATVGMFRAVFAIASMAFGKLAGKVERKGRNWLTVKYATLKNPTATFEIPFKNNRPAWQGGTRPSPSADVQKKVSIGYTILQKAVDFVAADMDTYTDRKLAETARRYSAK